MIKCILLRLLPPPRIEPDPPRESVSFASALSAAEMQEATVRRKVHVMMRTAVRELAVHLVFLLLVCSLCYNNRSPSDYNIHTLVSGDLIDNGTTTGFKYVNFFLFLLNVCNVIFLIYIWPQKCALLFKYYMYPVHVSKIITKTST